MRGRWIALSPPRRLLTDLSHPRGFPRATLLTRINVAALVEPRDQARIPWPVVFAKAYSGESLRWLAQTSAARIAAVNVSAVPEARSAPGQPCRPAPWTRNLGMPPIFTTVS
jgi:hypothetical protein